MAAAPDVKMRNVFLGLDDDDAKRIEALRERGEFFWLDLDLDSPGAERLGELLPIPDYAMDLLRGFGSADSIFSQTYADEDLVVFPFSCIGDPAAPPLGPDGMQPQEVHVLVTGDCLATIHHGPCEPLRELAGEEHRVTRSEQHLVYTVLAQMVASVFQVLARLSAEAEGTIGDLGKAHTGRRHLAFIREGQTRLNHLRGTFGPQSAVFERVADEIPYVKGLAGDDQDHFSALRRQLDHAVSAIDAASNALSGMLDLGLNRMTFLFTVVATLFLPTTFLAGFWGQNFVWLTDHIMSTASWWVFGVGLMTAAFLVCLWAIRRQLGPREAPNDSPISELRTGELGD